MSQRGDTIFGMDAIADSYRGAADLTQIRSIARGRANNASTTPPPEEQAVAARPIEDIECGRISIATASAERIREHRECLMRQAEAEDERRRERRERQLASARERARREDKIYIFGRIYRVPEVVLIARDVFFFTFLGLTFGLGIDYAFSYITIPPDNVGAFFGLYLLQLNLNAVVIFFTLKLYERIWARNPNMYLGYTTFISVFYKSQMRFSIAGANFIESLHSPPKGGD